ncbi:MAG TPA: hypothetical protein VFL13_12865 [Candidatus Baltobacteraceae bacterium]|nr:hypothetical protein [Candidatus Baltobacteraceae bacterium]
MKRTLATIAAVIALAGCSGSGQGQGGNAGASAPPAPPLKNTLDFPLYQGASVVSSHDFTQNVQVSNPTNGSVFAAGSGTYTGREVIASSSASFSDLSKWVGTLASTPPSGYTSLETGANPNERAQAQKYGLDYATFTKPENGKTHGVLVIVMDPQRVNTRFGTILSMVAKYRALPEMMRAPIDNEAKTRFGMSLTEATQPESPIGAALAALDQFQHKSARGIVMIDALKR